MDDTDQEKMQAERMVHTESYRRDSPIQENLEIFQFMLDGNPKYIKYCLRYVYICDCIYVCMYMCVIVYVCMYVCDCICVIMYDTV